MAIGRTNAGGMSTADATAVAADILKGKTAYAGNTKVEGTMPNNTAETITLDTDSTSYAIPAGYHDGTGEVKLVAQEKQVFSSTSNQYVYPDSGCVLSKVSVWGTSSGTDVSDTTLTAANARSGYYFYDSSGNWTQGTMETFTPSSSTIGGNYYATSSYIDLYPQSTEYRVATYGKYMPYELYVAAASHMWTEIANGVYCDKTIGSPTEYAIWNGNYSDVDAFFFCTLHPGYADCYEELSSSQVGITKAFFLKNSSGEFTLVFYEDGYYSSSKDRVVLNSYGSQAKDWVTLDVTDSDVTLLAATEHDVYLTANRYELYTWTMTS